MAALPHAPFGGYEAKYPLPRIKLPNHLVRTMIRALAALFLAITILAIFMICAFPLDPAAARIVATAPGIGIQWLLKAIGILITREQAFVSTLMFWWLFAWLLLTYVLPGSPVFARAPVLICPFCDHPFSYTWKRYWQHPFGRHDCPHCKQPSKLRSGWRFWLFYVPLSMFSLLAIFLVGVGVYWALFPREADMDNVVWFIFSPWFAVSLMVWWVLFVFIDRAFDAEFRGLQAPKNAV